MEEDLIQQSLDDYDAGKYSPRLLTAHDLRKLSLLLWIELPLEALLLYVGLPRGHC